MDLVNLPEGELELYFNKLVRPAMQRGRVEGQEIPVMVRLLTRGGVLFYSEYLYNNIFTQGSGGAADDVLDSVSKEAEQQRHHFYDQVKAFTWFWLHKCLL